jgi:aminomethyltransferase
MNPRRQTCLHALHVARGARMVEFAGWEMPLHYGSQIDEHHAVRRGAGMFDVSHMLAVDLAGSDARAFLRYLLANDVSRLAVPGRALYSCMLNESGGVLDDLIVYFLGEGRYRLVVNAGTAERDLAWIESWRARRAGALELRARRDLAILAVQGPAARERFWHVRPELQAATAPLAKFHAVETDTWVVGRTGYTGEDGFEIMLPHAVALELWQALAAAGVTPAGLGARDTLRLEAGMNLYGQDMDEGISPMECGLGWTVALASTRDFVGRGALARQAARHQLGVVLEERGVMRARQTVRAAEGEGTITSGGFAPTLNRSIGLARLPAGVSAGSAVAVEVRGKWLNARTVRAPFVRNGKVLIDL